MTNDQTETRFVVKASELEMRERGRKKFEHIGELMDSIKRYGLLHALVVSERQENGKYLLLAGERRLRACLLLGMTDIPCTLKENLPPQVQKEIELEENVQREDLEWTEKIEILRQIDEIKRNRMGSKMPGEKEGEGWSTDKMVELTGMSRTNVARQIAFAKKLLERPDLKAEVKGLPLNVAIKVFEQKLETERLRRLKDSGRIELSHELALGKAEELVWGLEENSVDLVVTDPPFGIADLRDVSQRDNVREVLPYKKVLKEGDNADGDVVVRIMQRLLPGLFRAMKPKAHLYMFFANEMYQSLMDLLSLTGFEMHPVPIIWDKGRTTGPFMGYTYATSYEPILFGCKPPREKRLVVACRDIVLFKPLVSKDKRHPFEKPLELLKYFIRQSSNVGEVVLDPFAGSGSTLVAGKMLGRKVLGFEADEEHCLGAQRRLMETELGKETGMGKEIENGGVSIS